MSVRLLLQGALAAALLGSSAASSTAIAGDLHEVRLDWATYNPLSLVLKEQGLVEKAFAGNGVTVRWVQSRGSNKALDRRSGMLWLISDTSRSHYQQLSSENLQHTPDRRPRLRF